MKKLLPFLLLALFCVSSWTQTVPQLTTDENSPKLYTIASYNRGGYLTSNGAGQGVTHVATTKNSYWYFTAASGNTEGTADKGVIAHCFGDKTQLTTRMRLAMVVSHLTAPTTCLCLSTWQTLATSTR